ncbi:MAG: tetratricopeptide repeat protein [Deltaproteobacteria bacterium]|nr:tetratricopeptide repeat protein [Deltaproteobacteria bacterium]
MTFFYPLFVVSMILLIPLAGCPSKSSPRVKTADDERPFVAPRHASSGRLTQVRELMASRRFVQALKALGGYLPRHPADARAWFYKGECLRQMHEKSGALEAFRKAVGLKPEFPEKYVNLAGMLLLDNRLDEAESVLVKSVAQFPKEPGLHFNLGLVYLARKRLPAACASLNTAARLAPGVVSYRIGAGLCAFKMGRLAESVIHFKAAAKANPSNAAAHEGLARIFAARHQSAQAIKEARKAVQLDPANPGRRYFLAGLLLQAKHGEEAAAEYEQVAARIRGKSVIYVRWGQALVLAKKQQQAVGVLSKAVAALSSRTPARVAMDLAEVLAQVGRCSRAIHVAANIKNSAFRSRVRLVESLCRRRIHGH